MLLFPLPPHPHAPAMRSQADAARKQGGLCWALLPCWSQPAWPFPFLCLLSPSHFFPFCHFTLPPFPGPVGLFCGQTFFFFLPLGILGRTRAGTCVACGSSGPEGGGWAGGVTSWCPAYPTADHSCGRPGSFGHDHEAQGWGWVPFNLVFPPLGEPVGQHPPTPPTPAPPSGGPASGEGCSLGWAQWCCTCPIETLSVQGACHCR